MNYKLLCIGGSHNFKTLPWDGERRYYKTLKPPAMVVWVTESSMSREINLDNVEVYRIETLTTTKKQKHVYVINDMRTEEVYFRLQEYVMMQFIEMGDVAVS